MMRISIIMSSLLLISLSQSCYSSKTSSNSINLGVMSGTEDNRKEKSPQPNTVLLDSTHTKVPNDPLYQGKDALRTKP